MGDDDKIDPTHWLEESFAKAYPHAARRTILVDGNLKTEARSPLDILIDRGIIDYKQYTAGRFVMKLRLSINNILRTDRIVMEYLESNEPVDCVMSAGALLSAVMDNLKPWQVQMIDRICLQRQRQDYGYSERILNDNDYRWVSHCCESVKKSLDQLKINIDLIIKSCDNDSRGVGETALRIWESSL